MPSTDPRRSDEELPSGGRRRPADTDAAASPGGADQSATATPWESHRHHLRTPTRPKARPSSYQPPASFAAPASPAGTTVSTSAASSPASLSGPTAADRGSGRGDMSVGVTAAAAAVPSGHLATGRDDPSLRAAARDVAGEDRRLKSLAARPTGGAAAASSAGQAGASVRRSGTTSPAAATTGTRPRGDGPLLVAAGLPVVAAGVVGRESSQGGGTTDANGKAPWQPVGPGQRIVAPTPRHASDADAKAQARASAQARGVAQSAATTTSSSRTARAQREVQKMSMTDLDGGPTLAPAASRAVVAAAAPTPASTPGAYASAQAPCDGAAKRRTLETGPSLAPAEFAQSPPAPLPLPSSSVSPAAPPAVRPVDDDDELEEVHVGAYAVEGMDAHRYQDLSDDEYSVTDQNRPRTGAAADAELGYEDIFYVDPDARAALEPAHALPAELQVVVDGAILTEDDNAAEVLDPKAVKRLRLYQMGVLGCSILAIALMIGAFVGFRGAQAPESSGWLQVGPTLYGSQMEPQIFFGQSLDMTGDGQRIAVVAPGFDDETMQKMIGEVRIFDEKVGTNGTKWKPVGKITGRDASSAPQMSVSISENGQRVAVGWSRVGDGAVEIYDTTSKGWTLSANFSLAAGQGQESWFGYALDLSSDGDTLAVSAPMADTSSGSKSGLVRVYQRTTNGWTQLGEDIAGLKDNDLFGWSLAVQTNDGIRLVVGAPSSDQEKGLVRVFDWEGAVWKQVGIDLVGEKDLGRFGQSVAISGNGDILAVGAAGTAFVSGSVRVFRLKSKEWLEDAHSFLGEEPAEAFGTSVSLSNDGSILAVGASHAGADAGRIVVAKYDKSSGAWSNLGTSVEGAIGDDFGSSVRLSDDGLRFLGGAPSAIFDGSVAQVGAVRVYDRDE